MCNCILWIVDDFLNSNWLVLFNLGILNIHIWEILGVNFLYSYAASTSVERDLMSLGIFSYSRFNPLTPNGVWHFSNFWTRSTRPQYFSYNRDDFENFKVFTYSMVPNTKRGANKRRGQKIFKNLISGRVQVSGRVGIFWYI